MSPRQRLGVALLLDPPVAYEVDGLRRALGDRSLDLVGPHLTLVPPVNVRAGDVLSALDVLRRAAHAQDGPLELVLGPVAAFLPASPVVYLRVSGPGAGALARLRQSVLAGPLLRTVRWPWVPHVTLSDGIAEDRIAAAVAALGSYTAELSLDRVVLMEEADRYWRPIADACLGRPTVIGRGGLEIEITQGRVVGPDGVAMAQAQAEAPAGLGAAGLGTEPERAGGTDRIVLTARREGRVAGLAVAWCDEPAGSPVQVCVLVESSARRQGVGRSLMAALEPRAAAMGWARGLVRGHGPPGFFASCSPWAHDFEPAAGGG
jgi:2'-5' RNA ligase